MNTQPTLKVLPRFTSDGKADSIELVYTMKVSAAMGVINLGNLIHVIQMPLVLRQNLTHHKMMLIRFVIILTKISLEQLQGNLVHIQFLTRLRTQLIQSNWLRN